MSFDIRRADPASPEAVRCLEAYLAELDRRSVSGYDPTAGVSDEAHEFRPPLGHFLVAYVGSEAIGCGAVKHASGNPRRSNECG